MVFTQWFCLFITFLCFPGIISGIPSTNNNLQITHWYSIILITLHQLMNSIGATVTYWWTPFKKGKGLWIPTILRPIFIVLFLLCVKPRLIESDVAPCCFIIIFSFSNGLLSSLTAMYTPGLEVLGEDEKELAGQFINFAFNLGIVSGTTGAYILNVSYLNL